MWPFKSAPRASSPRLVDLENGLSEAQAAIAWLRKSVVDLNGRMSTIQRQQKPREDAPQEPIEQEEPQEVAPITTAHLARRFRGF